MDWKIIDSGKRSAKQNMNKDAELLMTLSKEAIVHFYDWERDAATFGHFIDPARYFDLEKVKEKQLDLAQRPTGGGIVFHMTDFAFSILVPSIHPAFSLSPLDNYLYINRKVGLALEEFLGVTIELLHEEDKDNKDNFCMAKPTKYDLIVRGKKVGGAAQRKTRAGYLHQGSLLLGHPPSSYLQAVLKDLRIIEKMKENSRPLLGEDYTPQDLISARHHLKNLFTKAFL